MHSMCFNNLKPWRKISLIPKLKASKLIGEESSSLWIPFWTLKILYRVNCSHTHHQNGVVEHKHRHITNLGLTLLKHASLSLKFWEFAFTTVVFLMDRLPTASLNFEVPFTTLYKHPPDYNFLKSFGCLCYPFLRSYNNHKLEFLSYKCLSWIFLFSQRL